MEHQGRVVEQQQDDLRAMDPPGAVMVAGNSTSGRRLLAAVGKGCGCWVQEQEQGQGFGKAGSL